MIPRKVNGKSVLWSAGGTDVVKRKGWRGGAVSPSGRRRLRIGCGWATHVRVKKKKGARMRPLGSVLLAAGSVRDGRSQHGCGGSRGFAAGLENQV